MFIAMNRFRVANGSDGISSKFWLSRDSHLDKVSGFVEFPFGDGPHLSVIEEEEFHSLVFPRAAEPRMDGCTD